MNLLFLALIWGGVLAVPLVGIWQDARERRRCGCPECAE